MFGYIAIALLLVGTLMLMPRIAVMLLAALPLPRGGRAAPRAGAAARRAGASGGEPCGDRRRVSLMVSMAIMVASFRVSLDAWLERILPADLYVRAGAAGDTAYLGADDQARLTALPGVRRAEFQREQQLLLDPARPRVVLLARSIDAANPARQLQLVRGPVTVAPGAPPPVWVNEAMLDLYGFAPGERIELPIAGKPASLTVAGVWRDYARPQGAIVDRARALYRADRRPERHQRRALARVRRGSGRTEPRDRDATSRARSRLEIAAPGKSASYRSRHSIARLPSLMRSS